MPATLEARRAKGRAYQQANREVMSLRTKEYLRTHPLEAAEARRKWNYKKKYGITPEQYDLMLELQGGVCAVCGHPPKTVRLSVDHDHKTGRVRCLACFVCNKFRIGPNTPETSLRIAEICNSDFDGRLLTRSSLQKAPEAP